MKKIIAGVTVVIAAIYLLLCVAVYIPKHGFKEMLTDIIISSLFLMVGAVVLFIELRYDEEDKPSPDAFLGKALLKMHKCPNCFWRMNKINCSDRRETLYSCANCGVSHTTVRTLEANYFNEAESSKRWIEKTAYFLDWKLGDGTEEGSGTGVVKKRGDKSLKRISARLRGKVNKTPFYSEGASEKKLIADAEKIIKNVCPVCDCRLSRYTGSGHLEKTIRIEVNPYNRVTVSSQSRVVDNYTRISCPSIHGVYSIHESREGEYFCKTVRVNGDAPKEVFEAAQLCSDIRSKNKYWGSIEEIKK